MNQNKVRIFGISILIALFTVCTGESEPPKVTQAIANHTDTVLEASADFPDEIRSPGAN